MTTIRTAMAALAASALFACASSQPSAQLEQARARYHTASNYEAIQLTPDVLYEARTALQRAEQAHEEDPGSYEEISLAYVAERRADLAIAKANIAYAKKAKQNAEEVLSERRQGMLEQSQEEYQRTSQNLQETERQLSSTQAEVAEERRARMEAETRAERAMQSLREVAMVKEEARGTVITLDGSVLFLVGKAQLLPIAQERLELVAKTIKDVGEDDKLRIEGHTDSQGGEEMNRELSRQRAQSVADFLATQGIDRSRMSVVGMGESQPVASNDSPEGRANNRRVEIIIGNENGSWTGSSGATTPGTSGQQSQQGQPQQSQPQQQGQQQQ